VLAGAVLLAACCTVEWNGGGSLGFTTQDVQFERVDEVALPLAAGGSLRAMDLCGDVDVRVDSGPPRLVARWTGFGEDAARAEQALVDARIEVTGDATSVEVRATAPLRDHRLKAQADLTFLLPSDVALFIATSSGDVSVAGPVRSAELSTRYGDVKAASIVGDVRARSSSGDLRLEAVGGAVDAETAYGDVTLSECTGATVEASSSSGNVVAGGGATADWRLESKYGDVRLTGGAGTLAISTSSGRVEVTGFNGSVRARDGYGDIELAGRFSSVDAESSSGDVTLRLEGCDGPLRELALESRYGDVELVACVPLDAELVAKTSYGEVECELEVAATRRDEDGRRLEGRFGAIAGPEAATGTASGASAVVRLVTASGDVRLRGGGR
jgi:hypothetical protein